jgi:hypothetical protein
MENAVTLMEEMVTVWKSWLEKFEEGYPFWRPRYRWKDNIQMNLLSWGLNMWTRLYVNYWVMHPVARVSVIIYRNLHVQQMSVLVLLYTSYTTCFSPYWWPSSGGFVTQKI